MCRRGAVALESRKDSKKSQDTNGYDFARLERAIRGLAKRGQQLESENESLRADLSSRDAKVRELDERLIEVHQLRQDAVKRIDDLISQIDQIGDRLEDQFMGDFEAIGSNVPLRVRRINARGVLTEEIVMDIQVGVDRNILGSLPDPTYKDRDPRSGF